MPSRRAEAILPLPMKPMCMEGCFGMRERPVQVQLLPRRAFSSRVIAPGALPGTVSVVEKDTIWETPVAADTVPERGELPPVPWDPNEYSAMWCRPCNRPRVFRRRRINHSRHLLLALGTLGLWLPVWGLILLLQPLRRWTCLVCGGHQRHN